MRNSFTLVVFPLYPQYASAITGSSIQDVLRIVGRRQVVPNVKIVSPFRDHPLFIAAFGEANRYCCRAQYFRSTRLFAKELGLGEDEYTIPFRSRLGKIPWLRPYTDRREEHPPLRPIGGISGPFPSARRRIPTIG